MNHPPSTNHRSSARRRNHRASGFTLIEAALTTVIVGTGVLAIVAAQQAYHMKNNWAQRSGTAMLMANELRELTLTLPMYDPILGRTNFGAKGDNVATFNCVADFAGSLDDAGKGEGLTFSPPINAMREPLEEYDRWRQVVNVHNVLPDYINTTIGQPLGTTDLMRVHVDVQYREPHSDTFNSVTTLTWVVTR